MTDVEELARKTIDCGFHIHKKLGPGLLESVYEAVLAASLERAGLRVERQKPSRSASRGSQSPMPSEPTLLSKGR